MVDIENYDSPNFRINGQGTLVGVSDSMRVLFYAVTQIAPTQRNVLIQGPTGTGKEGFARALHYNSPERQGGNFVAINCAGLSPHLLESELFGHVRGAFTDARETRTGLVQSAEKGTLFLDEIGDMPPELQAKILRMIEEREIRKVGSNRSEPVDVRLVAATNRDLTEMIRTGEFREDLYFRLGDARLTIPSLAERLVDVPYLARHLLDGANGVESLRLDLHSSAIQALQSYEWPGNVRELRSVMEDVALLGREGGLITGKDIELLLNHDVAGALWKKAQEGEGPVWYQEPILIIPYKDVINRPEAISNRSRRRQIFDDGQVYAACAGTDGAGEKLLFLRKEDARHFFVDPSSDGCHGLEQEIESAGVQDILSEPFCAYSAAQFSRHSGIYQCSGKLTEIAEREGLPVFNSANGRGGTIFLLVPKTKIEPFVSSTAPDKEGVMHRVGAEIDAFYMKFQRGPNP